MKKYCTVTYTTFDQKPRELVWDVTHISEKSVNDIIEYVKKGEWPKARASKDTFNIGWGLRHDPSVFSYNADLFGPGYMLKLPNKTQYTFYYDLVQRKIVRQLATECSMDADFGKALLKEAAVGAKKKDEKQAEHYNRADYRLNRDALNRAKQRIRYYQKKYDYDDHTDVSDFANVIEEYELFAVLDIQLSVAE